MKTLTNRQLDVILDALLGTGMFWINDRLMTKAEIQKEWFSDVRIVR